MATRILSTAQLAQLGKAALENANALLTDARVLLEAGSWPRAHALAVLSAEEFGKFYACVVAGTYDESDVDDWKRFWKDFRAHRSKLSSWAGQFVDQLDWGEVGQSGDAQWKRAWDARGDVAKQGDLGKQAAFYVDFKDGNVSVPDLVISEETARTTVDAVGSVVEPAASTFSGDLTASIARGCEIRDLLVEFRNYPSSEAAFTAFLDELLKRH
jgi:AbiV family abortive infection protein